MYKINPASVDGAWTTSWWQPICHVSCKTWPIMNTMMKSSSSSSMSKSNDSFELIKTFCNFTGNSSQWPGAEHQFSYVLALLFGIPATLIIIITVFGNFLVLCFKAKVGKRQTMLLIWNLGLADFLVGVFVLPLGVSSVIGRKWPFGRVICRIWVSCDVIFCTASMVTLCIISVDRYIGVTRPLRYKLIVTKTKVVISIIAIWVFSISILLATIRYHPDEDECYNPNVCHAGNELEYVVHSVVFAFFLPTLVTLVLYWKIYKVAKRREKGLAQGLILAMGQNFFKECFAVPLRIHCGKDTVSQQQAVIRMHKRVAKTLGVVVSAFVVCWGPFFALYIIGYQCGGCIPSLILDITSWLGYCNSMINPVIYAFTVDEFKRTLKVLFCSICRRRDARRASATQHSDIGRTGGGGGGGVGRPGTSVRSTLYPPASNLPRSNRAYSLVPAAEEQALSLVSPFFQRKKRERSESPPHADETQKTDDPKTALTTTTSNSSTRKRASRRSKKCVGSSCDAISTLDNNHQHEWAKRQASTPDRKRSRKQHDDQNDEDEYEVGLISADPSVRRPFSSSSMMHNGTVNDSIDQLDAVDEHTGSDQWNAKLYCTLISSQSTGL